MHVLSAGGEPLASGRDVKGIESVDEFDLRVKLAVYSFFARETVRPAIADVAGSEGLNPQTVGASFRRLVEQRVLVLEEDGATIRMAPPFSGVPTQHVAQVDGREYFANCAWDVLGIVAAIGAPGIARSRCEQSEEPFRLEVGPDGPEASDWLFHSVVPASRWWADIVFT